MSKILGGVFVLISAVMIWIGVSRGISAHHLTAGGVVTLGKVSAVDIQVVRDRIQKTESSMYPGQISTRGKASAVDSQTVHDPVVVDVNQTRYYATIGFTLASGEHREFKPSGYSTVYSVGQFVPVIYWPDEPENARVFDHDEIWAPVIFLLVFGSIFGLFGVGAIVAGNSFPR